MAKLRWASLNFKGEGSSEKWPTMLRNQAGRGRSGRKMEGCVMSRPTLAIPPLSLFTRPGRYRGGSPPTTSPATPRGDKADPLGSSPSASSAPPRTNISLASLLQIPFFPSFPTSPVPTRRGRRCRLVVAVPDDLPEPREDVEEYRRHHLRRLRQAGRAGRRCSPGSPSSSTSGTAALAIEFRHPRASLEPPFAHLQAPDTETAADAPVIDYVDDDPSSVLAELPDGGSPEPDATADGYYYMETADDQE
ncbi:uncharacterized protein [Aegilops tauschii subsp. strangulata]|uniref:uncharacterized protein n=1 Tax=Aegilops tauschii subsp. strangulata TaxID=200361 RepID=UPI003CC84E0F